CFLRVTILDEPRKRERGEILFERGREPDDLKFVYLETIETRFKKQACLLDDGHHSGEVFFIFVELLAQSGLICGLIAPRKQPLGKNPIPCEHSGADAI